MMDGFRSWWQRQEEYSPFKEKVMNFRLLMILGAGATFCHGWSIAAESVCRTDVFPSLSNGMWQKTCSFEHRVIGSTTDSAVSFETVPYRRDIGSSLFPTTVDLRVVGTSSILSLEGLTAPTGNSFSPPVLSPSSGWILTRERASTQGNQALYSTTHAKSITEPKYLVSSGSAIPYEAKRFDLTQQVSTSYPKPTGLALSSQITGSYQTGKLVMSWYGTNNFDGRAALLGMLTAVDQNGKNVPINEAARRMGFDHFNWIQVISESSILSQYNFTANASGRRYLPGPEAWDPLPGGWVCQDCFPDPEPSPPDAAGDSAIFYQDEVRVPGRNHVSEYRSLLTRFDGATASESTFISAMGAPSTQAMSQVFLDAPAAPMEGYNGFTTQVVGIRADGSAEILEGESFGVSWLWSNFATNTGILQILGEGDNDPVFKKVNLEEVSIKDFLSASGLDNPELRSKYKISASAVPEPEASWLWVIGLAWLCLRRGRV